MNSEEIYLYLPEIPVDGVNKHTACSTFDCSAYDYFKDLFLPEFATIPFIYPENFDLVENTDRTMLISKEMPYIDNICDGDTVEGCQDPEWKVFQSGSISKRSPCPCRQR